MNVNEYPDEELMAVALANKLAGELENVLVHEDRASLAVPGGTTPGPIFDALCAADLDWSRVDVMLTDERWRPEVHVRSNARLVRERLLQSRAEKAVFHPFYTGAEHPDATLAEVESSIYPSMPLSVLLLGMGSDMHTASLFPGGKGLEEALDERSTRLLGVIEAPNEPELRVTLTAHALNGAMRKHLVIRGKEKREALERAQRSAPMKAPVKAVLEGLQVHWAP